MGGAVAWVVPNRGHGRPGPAVLPKWQDRTPLAGRQGLAAACAALFARSALGAAAGLCSPGPKCAVSEVVSGFLPVPPPMFPYLMGLSLTAVARLQRGCGGWEREGGGSSGKGPLSVRGPIHTS